MKSQVQAINSSAFQIKICSFVTANPLKQSELQICQLARKDISLVMSLISVKQLCSYLLPSSTADAHVLHYLSISTIYILFSCSILCRYFYKLCSLLLVSRLFSRYSPKILCNGLSYSRAPLVYHSSLWVFGLSYPLLPRLLTVSSTTPMRCLLQPPVQVHLSLCPLPYLSTLHSEWSKPYKARHTFLGTSILPMHAHIFELFLTLFPLYTTMEELSTELFFTLLCQLEKGSNKKAKRTICCLHSILGTEAAHYFPQLLPKRKEEAFLLLYYAELNTLKIKGLGIE